MNDRYHFSSGPAPIASRSPARRHKILLSACLLGDPVRYDGKSKPMTSPLLDNLVEQGRVVTHCPEVAGGLPIPRAAAEIQAGGGAAVVAGMAKVESKDGDDLTDAFISGARQALATCRQHQIQVAVLTEFSPSCGSQQIYDGHFTRNPIDGYGVTTALLRSHGITVFNQFELETAIEYLSTFEK